MLTRWINFGLIKNLYDYHDSRQWNGKMNSMSGARTYYSKHIGIDLHINKNRSPRWIWYIWSADATCAHNHILSLIPQLNADGARYSRSVDRMH